MAVQPGFRPYFLAAVLGVAEVFYFYLIAASGRDDDLVKFLRFLDLTNGPNCRFLLAFVEPAAWEFHVLDLQRSRDFGRRDVIRTHFVRIDPDIDLPFLPADDRNLADTVYRFDLFLNTMLCDVGYIPQRVWGGSRDGNTQNGRRIRVEFLHGRLLGRFGKLRNDRLYAIFDLLGSDVYILFKHKLNENLRNTLDRRGAQFVDTADCIYSLFNFLGYLCLDFLRRGTRICDRDRDRRKIDLRKKIDAEAKKGKCTDDHKRHDQHRGENGTLYTNFSKPLHNSSKFKVQSSKLFEFASPFHYSFSVHLPDKNTVRQRIQIARGDHVAFDDACFYLYQTVFQ